MSDHPSDPAEYRDVRGNTIKPEKVDSESVHTEEAVIDGTASNIHWEHITTLDTADKTSVSTSVSGFDYYRIEYFIDCDQDDDNALVGLRLNEDSGDMYTYFDQSGTKHENQSEYLIYEADESYTQSTGIIELRRRLRTGILHTMGGGRGGSVVSYGDAGHYDDGPVTDIEIFATEGFVDSSEEVIIYGGDKA